MIWIPTAPAGSTNRNWPTCARSLAWPVNQACVGNQARISSSLLGVNDAWVWISATPAIAPPWSPASLPDDAGRRHARGSCEPPVPLPTLGGMFALGIAPQRPAPVLGRDQSPDVVLIPPDQVPADAGSPEVVAIPGK